MQLFRYKSYIYPKNIFLPYASDTNQFNTKTEALRYLRSIEKDLASQIETMLQNGAGYHRYYIFCNRKRLIATAEMGDDATLIAEAMASHSPYVNEVDVMCYDGLICHYLASDFRNDRRNHVRKNP